MGNPDRVTGLWPGLVWNAVAIGEMKQWTEALSLLVFPASVTLPFSYINTLRLVEDKQFPLHLQADQVVI